MSFFFEIFEKNKAYNVGYFGGAGFNTLFKDILLLQNRPVSVREEFLNSFKKVREEKVDIVLGNHPRQNETLEKREKMIANNSENPFINPTEWQKFCDTMTSEFIKFMERDK
jgi:metallo-beta-lactamase class B